MIKHIVLFKLKHFDNAAQKEQLMLEFKGAIEALKEHIVQVVDIHVAINCNPAEEYDILLDSTFASMEDLNTYATHPLHVAAASLLKDAKEGRACVDYVI